MATCAECVHVEVCSEYVEGLAAVRGLKLVDVEEISAILQCDDCEHFKDRSRFVELPLPISEGAKLYYIFEEIDDTMEVGKSRATVTRVCKDGFYVSSRVQSDGTYYYGDDFYPWDAIGTEFFFTREEAEQALKEREKNEK